MKNEKNHNYVYIICLFAYLFTGIFFGYFISNRQYRDTSRELKELQLTTEARQRESEQLTTELRDTITELRDTITELEYNNLEAERIVKSMGEQLDGDSTSITTIGELLRHLREKIEYLQGCYSHSNSSINSRNNGDM